MKSVPVSKPKAVAIATADWKVILNRKPLLYTCGGLLLAGLLWGLWHYPIFSASGLSSGSLSPLTFTLLLLFTWLIPYRVLMVWAYDHTHSVLLSILMHVPIVADQFVLNPATALPEFTAASNIIFAVALWVVVGVICVAGGGRLEAFALRTSLQARKLETHE